MAPPQGLMEFPGIEQILSGTFTLSHGISPSAGVLTAVPGEDPALDVGTFKITFGNKKIEFKNCAVNRIASQSGASGKTSVFQILDRRWKWKFPTISGEYNIRAKDGITIQDGTKKNRRELVEMLLEALGETGYDATDVDTTNHDYVKWDVASAASELARLAEKAHCTVVLQTSDIVRVKKRGQGKNLPNDNGVTADNLAIDSRIKPDSIGFVAGPTKYQSRLYLGEAVGQEADGRVVWIEDLSYKPIGGWESENPTLFDGVQAANSAEYKRNKALAQKWVFRAYRVTAQADGTLKVPGYSGTVEKIEQILPLGDGQISTYKDPDNVLRPNEATVRGTFWNNDLAHKNTPADTLYDGDFTVDRERGIVFFSQPVVQFLEVAGDIYNVEPELYLQISYNVKDHKTRAFDRYRENRKLLNNKTEPLIIRRDEVAKTVIADYELDNDLNPTTTVRTTFDNLEDIKKTSKAYLDITQRSLSNPTAVDREYAGIREDIEIDGAIQQISWSVGPNGATTRASRNCEFSLDVDKFDERRRVEETARQIEESVELRQILIIEDRKAART